MCMVVAGPASWLSLTLPFFVPPPIARTAGRLPNLPAAAAFDIRVLLTELGMPELATRFEEEEVTPGLLPFMDDTAMRELGVNSVGARLRLRSAAQSLFG